MLVFEIKVIRYRDIWVDKEVVRDIRCRLNNDFR